MKYCGLGRYPPRLTALRAVHHSIIGSPVPGQSPEWPKVCRRSDDGLYFASASGDTLQPRCNLPGADERTKLAGRGSILVCSSRSRVSVQVKHMSTGVNEPGTWSNTIQCLGSDNAIGKYGRRSTRKSSHSLLRFIADIGLSIATNPRSPKIGCKKRLGPALKRLVRNGHMPKTHFSS